MTEGGRHGSTSAVRARLVNLSALLAVVAFVAVMVGPTLFGGRVFAATDILERTAPWAATTTYGEPVTNYCVSDTVDSVLPSMVEARERLLAGDLPAWNAETVAGAPLMSTPLQGLQSPIVLATILLPPTLAVGWAKVVEVAVVVLGGVLLARRLGLTAGAGGVAALAFASSGFVVMWTNWPQARTAAFYPLVLWAVERVLQDRTLRSVLPLPLVLGGLVLGGFPAVVVYLAYVVTAWVLVRAVSIGRREGAAAGVRAVCLLAAAGVVAVGLLLAPLISIAQWLGAADIGSRVQSPPTLDLRPTQMSTTLFPRVLGACGDGTWGWNPSNPVEGGNFVGVGVAFLVMLGVLLPRPARLPRGLVPLLVAVAVLTFGASFVGRPMADVLLDLPGVGSSLLGRTRVVGGLALAVLAGLGFHQLAFLGGPLARPVRARLAAGTVLLLLTGGVLLGYARRAAPDAEAWARVAPTVTVGLVSAAIGVLAVLGMLSGVARTRYLAAVLLPLAMLAEALAFTGAFWARPASDTFYRTTPVHAFLERELGTGRIASVGDIMYRGAETAYDLRSLTGHSFASEEWNDVVESIDPDARGTVSGTRLTSPDTFSAPGLDRFAVSHLLTDARFGPPGADVVTGDVPEAGSRVVLLPGEVTSVPVAAGVEDLGAVYLDLLEAPEQDVTVTAVVSDRSGEVLDESTTVVPADVTLPLWLPFLPQDDRPARVTYSVSAPLTVRGTGDGRPWLAQREADPMLSLVFRGGAWVYRNEDALERYRWASTGTVVEPAARRAALVSSAELDPDLVVLEEPAPFDGLPATVRVLEDAGDSRVVEVEAAGAGMLVVADGLFPGWSATVDGRQVPLLAADHALMGVPVGSGSHVVELTYRAPVPGWVYLVTALSAATLLAGVVWTRRGPILAVCRRRLEPPRSARARTPSRAPD